MSSKSNVNTDHYKTAGRGRQGERLVAEVHKHAFAQARPAVTAREGAFFPRARAESARTTRLGKVRLLMRLRRRGKPRGLSPRQLMERRIRERRAKA